VPGATVAILPLESLSSTTMTAPDGTFEVSDTHVAPAELCDGDGVTLDDGTPISWKTSLHVSGSAVATRRSEVTLVPGQVFLGTIQLDRVPDHESPWVVGCIPNYTNDSVYYALFNESSTSAANVQLELLCPTGARAVSATVTWSRDTNVATVVTDGSRCEHYQEGSTTCDPTGSYCTTTEGRTVEDTPLGATITFADVADASGNGAPQVTTFCGV